MVMLMIVMIDRKAECGNNIMNARWPDDVRLVVRDSDLYKIIKQEHEKLSHPYARKTFKTMQISYAGVKREVVDAYVERCTYCNTSRYDVNKRKRTVIRAIRSLGVMQHFTFDIISYISNPSGPNNDYKYVLHGICHFSKFTMVEPLKQKGMDDVYICLRRWFNMFGLPAIAQSDNGKEFINHIINELMKNNSIEYRHGQPYTPQTQVSYTYTYNI
jgi:hypothetical protein